jgi:hypothetical protein
MGDPMSDTELAPFGLTADGSPRKSAYFAVIGPSPHCEPGDRGTALLYLQKIELALTQFEQWSPYELNRLKKLRAKWARRAHGKDPRFNLVGTRKGRLTSDVEYELGRRVPKDGRPHPYYADKEERRLKTFDSRVPGGKRKLTEEQMQAREDALAWKDLDLPQGKAKGVGRDLDAEHDAYEPEPGPVELPTISASRQYLIPGQDGKGHGHRVYCRLMPAHYRAVCAIERSKVFGFRTVGDVFRWCVDYGVRELTTRSHNPQAVSALTQVGIVREILADEQYYQEFEQMFEQMTTTVNRHLSSGAKEQAVRVIALVRHQIEQMGEEYWRNKFMGELMQRYGSYIDGAQGNAADFGDSE